MKKLTLLLSFALLINLSFAQQKTDSQLATEFDKLLSEQFKTNETGATALVARNGQIIYKNAFGMADLELGVPMQEDNVFRIGSITKQFTAVAILQLMEQGKLNLQDEITRFIPDYPTQGYTITIEHLLTHTSGIKSYTEMEDYGERMTLDMEPTEMIDHFKNQPMEFAPGTKWNYSNSGYFLLGYIIEKIAGKTYREYLEENFFKPLGMTNSLYGTDQRIIKNRVSGYTSRDGVFENAHPLSMSQPYAAGSILSTVGDLFKWNQAIHSFKLVKKESLDKAFTNYKLADGTTTNYGYGWFFGNVQESPSIEHGGGINGSLTMAIYLPDEDVFVAVFSSCECNDPEEIAVRIAALAIGKSFEHESIKVEKSILQAYTGVFENEKGEQRIITLDDDHLYSQRGRNTKLQIKAFEIDKFFFEGVLLTIEFSRNNKEEIEKAITSGRQGTEVWTKTNNPIRMPTEIKLDDKILETYVGEYEIEPEFTFIITKDQGKLLVQPTGQEIFEIFAETETKFFVKINDAQLEFVKDDAGMIIKAILTQGGRETDALKIK